MKRILSFLLAVVSSSALVYAGAPLFSGSNFREFPTGWSVTDAADCTVTVVQGMAPTGGADTASLQLSDASAAGQCGIRPLINGGHTFSGPLVVEFDVKTSMVMDGEEATKYNRLYVNVYDASKAVNSEHTAVALHLSRSAGAGAETSRLAFSGLDGVTAGYVDPESWYHLKITLPGAGAGEATAVLTGLGGAKVYDLSEQEIPAIVIKQSQGGQVSDYESLSISSGNVGDGFLKALISNINVVQGQ